MHMHIFASAAMTKLLFDVGTKDDNFQHNKDHGLHKKGSWRDFV